jgi:hypothetical protein
MSRQELAEAVNAHVFATTGRVVNLDANYVGKLERGGHRWPRTDYRAGFRAILGAATDAELGFYVTRRSSDDQFALQHTLSAVGADDFAASPVVHRDVASVQLVVAPGTAVVVVPSDHPVLLALVAGEGMP